MVKILIGAAVVLVLFFLVIMYIDNHRFVVRGYSIHDARIKKEVRAVFVADLHEKDYGDQNEALIAKIRELSPDLILVGGDLLVSLNFTNRIRRQLGIRHMYEGDGMTPPAPEDLEWMKNSIPFIGQLNKIAPVYLAEGNHELRLRYHACTEYARAFWDAVSKTGVNVQGNGSCVIRKDGEDTGIVLQGLNLPIDYYEKFRKIRLLEETLEKLIGRPDPAYYTVLLTHSPVYFDSYAAWGADLSLCGHVHGGLMRLPLVGGVVGTGPNLFPKYSGGVYKKDGKKMIVTCGLGAHTLPVRIFNPGEISLIAFRPLKD